MDAFAGVTVAFPDFEFRTLGAILLETAVGHLPSAVNEGREPTLPKMKEQAAEIEAGNEPRRVGAPRHVVDEHVVLADTLLENLQILGKKHFLQKDDVGLGLRVAQALA